MGISTDLWWENYLWKIESEPDQKNDQAYSCHYIEVLRAGIYRQAIVRLTHKGRIEVWVGVVRNHYFSLRVCSTKYT